MTRTRKQNELRATVLDQLYAKRPISRIDISKETQITPATTGSIINELIKEGLVLELGELNDESVGRKKTLLDIAPRSRYYLGFEISEKQLAIVIADNTGEIAESSIRTYQIEVTGGPSDQEIIRLIQDFLKKNSQYPISAIALGLPGHVNLSESDFIISKNPHWGQINLRTIQEAFDLPVYFANKSHCLTMAERLFSYHPTDSNFIVYHVARGIHCSYMYKGSIYSQDNYLIGEVGHTVINPEGERCPCGKHGCLQVYASESALIDKAAILYRASQTSLLKTLVEDANDIDLTSLMTAYRLGDLGSIELIHTACRYLAISISNLCQLIDSERIYLDGQLFSYPVIAEQVLAQLEQEVPLFPKQKQAEIVIIPYSKYSIARSAVSLCVYHEFLDKKGNL